MELSRNQLDAFAGELAVGTDAVAKSLPPSSTPTPQDEPAALSPSRIKVASEKAITRSAAIRRIDSKSSYALTDKIEYDAFSAPSIFKAIGAESNAVSRATIGNRNAMPHLTSYYTSQIRGATQLKANDRADAWNSHATAYVWRKEYSTLVNSLFAAMEIQRGQRLPLWPLHDEAVLGALTDLGGKGVPSLETSARKARPLR